MADAPKESPEIFLGLSLISYIKDGTKCGEKPVLGARILNAQVWRRSHEIK
jgi:hypothetical protein